MSKLADKIRDLIQGGGSTLGFALPNSQAAPPPLILIAFLEDASAKNIKGAASKHADVVIVDLPDLADEAGPKALLEGAQDVSVGLYKDAVSKADAELWHRVGGDFVAFSARDTSAGIFLNDEISMVLSTSVTLDDSLVQAVGSLPLEALIVSLADGAGISVAEAMSLRRLVDLSGTPLFLEVSPDWPAAEVEILPNLGVLGVIVKGDKIGPRLDEIHEAIDKMPASTQRSRRRSSAIIPTSPVFAEHEEEEPE